MLYSKFLDPKNDFAFKYVFGAEAHKDILIDFINAVIGFKEDERIQTVTFLKPNLDPEVAHKKQSLIDVLCADEHGRQYIIEMQVVRTTGFEKRAQYYAAKTYSRQLNQGEDYEQLKAVIFVAITDFVMFPDKTAYLSRHCVLDQATHQHDLKDFSFTFLELPKFNKGIHELTNVIERWAYFFKHAGDTREKETEQVAGADMAINHAYEALNRFSWTDDDLIRYERQEKYERDERAVLSARLEDATAEGLEKGIAKGIEEGFAKGIEEGHAKGFEEGLLKGIQQQRAAIINLLLKANPTLSAIELSKITGFSVEEIRKSFDTNLNYEKETE